MVRLQRKYFVCLFLQALLILLLGDIGFAAQKAEANKNEKSNEATVTADTVKSTEVTAKADTVKSTEVSATAGAEKSDAASGNQPNNFIYDPTGKTDPFKSFIAIREEEEKAKTKTYLETVDLSQLDLVVIVIGPKGKWAMVQDKKGSGHVIKEGTPIGTNNGVVSKISRGEVIIREEYKDFRGQTQYREISKTSSSQM
jgi:type IV pilus assembly protein PilP